MNFVETIRLTGDGNLDVLRKFVSKQKNLLGDKIVASFN